VGRWVGVYVIMDLEEKQLFETSHRHVPR
jgi:hypothetical protein